MQECQNSFIPIALLNYSIYAVFIRRGEMPNTVSLACDSHVDVARGRSSTRYRDVLTVTGIQQYLGQQSLNIRRTLNPTIHREKGGGRSPC